MTKGLASRLLHRMALESPVLTPDGMGGFVKTWQEVSMVWAELTPVSGNSGERLRAACERGPP